MSTKFEKEWVGRCRSLQRQHNEQIQLLTSRHNHKITLLTTIRDFLKKKSDIEAQYSKQLDQLSVSCLKQLQTVEKQGAYGQVFMENLSNIQDKNLYEGFSKYLKLHTNMSVNRSEYANQSLINVHDSINHLITSTETSHKKSMEVFQRVQANLIDSANKILILQKIYESLALEESTNREKVEKAKTKAERSTLKDKDKAKAPKKSHTAKTLREVDKFKVRLKSCEEKTNVGRNDLLMAIKSFNKQYSYFYSHTSVELINSIEYFFTNACQEAVAMYLSLTKKLSDKDTKFQEKIKSYFSNITQEAEIDSISKSHSFVESEHATFASFSKTEPNYLVVTELECGTQLKKKLGELTEEINTLKKKIEEESGKTKLLEKENEANMELNTKNLQFNVSPVLVTQIAERMVTKSEADFELAPLVDLLRHVELALNGTSEPIVKIRQLGRLATQMSLRSSSTNNTNASKSSLRSRMVKGKSSKKGLDDVLFGGRLDAHQPLTVEDLVPKIINYCCETVEKVGMTTKGIYRMSGGVGEINTLKAQFENGEEPFGGTDPEGDVIHVVAGCLKLYLRELKDPLMTFALYSRFIEAGSLPPGTERQEQIKKVVQELPPINLASLNFICSSLSRIAQHSEENKMKPSNLGIVFGPTILQSADENATSMINDAHAQGVIVEELVEHYSFFFEDQKVIEMAGSGISINSQSVPEELDKVELADNQSTSSTCSPSIQSEDQIISTVFNAKVIFTYEAADDDELGLEEGEIIKIYDDSDDIWWVGEKNKIKGMVPREYVQRIESKPVIEDVEYEYTSPDVKTIQAEFENNKTDEVIQEVEYAMPYEDDEEYQKLKEQKEKDKEKEQEDLMQKTIQEQEEKVRQLKMKKSNNANSHTDLEALATPTTEATTDISPPLSPPPPPECSLNVEDADELDRSPSVTSLPPPPPPPEEDVVMEPAIDLPAPIIDEENDDTYFMYG